MPALAALSALTLTSAYAQNAQGGNASGTVTGGSVQGGNVTGGSVSGGSVTGSSVKGGDVTGGSVQGGTVTPGSVSSGTVTSGTVTAGKTGTANATASINGREITAQVEGSVSIQSSGAAAVVNLGAHTITVENERVLLDGQERAKLPPTTTKVVIQSTGGKISVRADGSEVLSTELENKK